MKKEMIDVVIYEDEKFPEYRITKIKGRKDIATNTRIYSLPLEVYKKFNFLQKQLDEVEKLIDKCTEKYSQICIEAYNTFTEEWVKSSDYFREEQLQNSAEVTFDFEDEKYTYYKRFGHRVYRVSK